MNNVEKRGLYVLIILVITIGVAIPVFTSGHTYADGRGFGVIAIGLAAACIIPNWFLDEKSKTKNKPQVPDDQS